MIQYLYEIKKKGCDNMKEIMNIVKQILPPPRYLIEGAVVAMGATLGIELINKNKKILKEEWNKAKEGCA